MNPKAMLLEGLGKFKRKLMALSGFEPVTSGLVA
jgi:hypothetical protein